MTQTMLIIDDEEVVLESCRRIFSAEGFHVVITPSPAEGLRLVSDSFFDIVLCDWKMPGFDGIDVVEQINLRSPASAVIMISGYPSVGRATESMKKGAMDYLAKPFTPEEITTAVKKSIQRKALAEQHALGRFEKIMASMTFPVPEMDDKPPKTIAETIASSVGVGKVTSPWFSVTVLGILAGAYIGFGGLLATTVTFDMPASFGIGLSRFMAGAAFSLGLMLVVIAGAELFTGNNLMISSALSKEITVIDMLKRWGVVYVANFAGSLVIALIFYFSGLWKTGNGALGQATVAIAVKKVALDFNEAFFRGIGCNWMVCLAVWMALAARQTVGKILAIFFPIMGFVAIGFEHCVANMYFIPMGILLKSNTAIIDAQTAAIEPLTWFNFVWKNLLPVTIGNIVGGALFVGMSYWGAYLKPTSEKVAGPAGQRSRPGM